MLKFKYLLLTSVVTVVSNNVLASEIKLTFDDTGSPLVNTYNTTHTPMELEPISLFNPDNSVKLAAVCAVGGGGCSGLEFGKSNNSMNLDKNVQCIEGGYVKTCPTGYVKDKNNICPHSSAYFKCRPAQNTCNDGYSLTACNSEQVQVYSYVNEAKNTCHACRDKTCAEGGYAASIDSCQKGTPVSFAKKTCYKNVTAKTCGDLGSAYSSSCPTNQIGTPFSYCGKICYTYCKQPACEEGGYKSAVPANNVCTDVTYYGRTCKTDCKQPTCEDGGYKSGVPTNQVCTPVSYYGRTCYKDCYQPQCSAGGYKDAVPTNNKCTSVTYYGRTCQKDCYQPTCEQGGYLSAMPTDMYCENKSYYGRTCYRYCEEVLPVLYSDMTVIKSNTPIPGKTPIGIVFDTDKRLAVALEKSPSRLTWDNNTTNIVDHVPDLEICGYNINNGIIDSCSARGKENTAAIIAHVKTGGISYPAAEYCYNYTTPGTKAGDWFLPSIFELQNILHKNLKIDTTLEMLEKNILIFNLMSSTLSKNNYPYSYINKQYWTNNSDKAYVLPIIQY